MGKRRKNSEKNKKTTTIFCRWNICGGNIIKVNAIVKGKGERKKG
jgi:hypothetical protein